MAIPILVNGWVCFQLRKQGFISSSSHGVKEHVALKADRYGSEFQEIYLYLHGFERLLRVVEHQFPHLQNGSDDRADVSVKCGHKQRSVYAQHRKKKKLCFIAWQNKKKGNQQKPDNRTDPWGHEKIKILMKTQLLK